MNARMIAEYRAFKELPDYYKISSEFLFEKETLQKKFRSSKLLILSLAFSLTPILCLAFYYFLSATLFPDGLLPGWLSALGPISILAIIPGFYIGYKINAERKNKDAEFEMLQSPEYSALLTKYRKMGYVELDFKCCYDRDRFDDAICSVDKHLLSDKELFYCCNSRKCKDCHRLKQALYD